MSLADTKFGLFLNLGANLAERTEDIFDFTLRQAELAESLGYYDAWLTEHHFIDFGINSSALTSAAFLLGRTTTLRVGTAVTLSPLYHPIELAERGALLDQFSRGRFDLGLGRGGYLKDYEVFGIKTERWEGEPLQSAATIVQAWERGCVNDTPVTPSVFTQPRPPLYLATRSPDGLKFAAEHGLGLQHYFATPVSARVQLQSSYVELGGAENAPHVHTLMVIVDEREEVARAQLQKALTDSFRGGDYPHVPQAKPHLDAQGNRVSSEVLAKGAASMAIIGSPNKVQDELGGFIEATRAGRVVMYMEALADQERTLESIETFAALAELA